MFYKIPLYLISIAFVVVISAGETTACDCVKYDAFAAEHVTKAKRDSNAVFTGKVQDIVQKQGSDLLYVEFEVLDVWKGRLTPKVTVVTGDWDGNCGFKFKRGEAYLVYVPSHKLYSPDAFATHTAPERLRSRKRKRTSPIWGSGSG
jgi:hypothetical protein